MTCARRAATLACAAALALGVAPPLAAQTQAEQDSTRADSIRASSARADSLRIQRMTAVVITGTRLSEVDERTPVQVDVLRLRDAPPGPGAAADIVARLPGVSAFDDQGNRAQPTLNIRGFTVSPVVGVPQGVSVFLDGVRINEPDAQQVYFDLIPMDAVERAELVRGPTALFGKNTLAGALLFFTRRGDATPRVDATAEAGHFGYRAGSVVASGVKRGVDAFLLARGSDEDGWRDETGARTRLVFGTLGRRSERGDVALSALVAHDRIGQAGSLPESWLRVNPRANYTGGDFFEPRLGHLALRGVRYVGAGGRGPELRGNLFARRNRTEQFNVNVGDPDVRAFIDGRTGGGAVELAAPLRLGGMPLALTVGAEYARNAVRYRIFNEPNAAADTLDDSCDEATGLCENASVDEDDAALYAQGVFGLGERLSVTGSARADWVRVPFRDLRDPANDGTSIFRRLSPRLGLNYQRGSVRGFVAAGGGFRAPAALELACADEAAPCPLPFSLGDDPPLRPVSVWNYETGIDWERSNLTLDVVVFRSDVRNEIVFAAAEAAAGFFQNVPRTRRQGVEASATLPLTRAARLRADYTYLDATYRSSVRLASALGDSASPVEPGDRFPLSPLHRGTVALGVTRLVAKLVLDGELSLSAVSSQYLRGDEANDYPPVPGYGVAHLRLEAEHERFAVTAHVTNLLDRRYETFGIYGENPQGPIGGPPPADPEYVERFLNPGYPRAVTVAIKAKF